MCSFVFSLVLWCLAAFMSSRRRLPDAKTPRRPRFYERLTAALSAGCTDTRARPITGPSSPAETRATCSPVPYPWPWSCPCQPPANLRNRRRRLFRTYPTRRRRRDEGTAVICDSNWGRRNLRFFFFISRLKKKKIQTN